MLGNIVACLPLAVLTVLGIMSLIKVLKRKKRYNILLRVLADAKRQPRCVVWGSGSGRSFVSKYPLTIRIPELNWEVTVGDSVKSTKADNISPEFLSRDMLDCNKCKNRLRCLIEKGSKVTFEGDELELTDGKVMHEESLIGPFRFGDNFTFEQSDKLADVFYDIRYGEREKLDMSLPFWWRRGKH